jgi:hypothetical protein
MLVVCRGIDKANEKFINELGKEEELYDMDLIGFGSAEEAMANGTNIDGTSCFDSGKFNGKKIAHCSTYTNASANANPILTYWNFETQKWGD